MSEHRHRFYRLALGRIGLTAWRCSCGIKTHDTRVVTALEGRKAGEERGE